MGTRDEINRPNSMLLSSALAKDGITLKLKESSVALALFRLPLMYKITAAKPMITLMLKILEPKTFPTERDEPPDIKAIIATVNSGKVVVIAIRVNPTEDFPKRVIVETLSAFVITRLLAQFKATNEIAIIITSIMN